jgi:hypothetical protein
VILKKILSSIEVDGSCRYIDLLVDVSKFFVGRRFRELLNEISFSSSSSETLSAFSDCDKAKLTDIQFGPFLDEKLALLKASSSIKSC